MPLTSMMSASVYRFIGCRCLAAGVRQRTTACERCSVLRTRPNPPCPLPLESIAGAVK